MLRSALSFTKTMSTSAKTIPTIQKAVFFRENGGPEVLKYEDYPVPKIGDNEVLVKNKYAGINFIEAYFRKGIYPSQKPYVLGREASGTIVAKGKNVTKFDVNDNVAYVSPGSMAQYTSVPEKAPIARLPASTTDEQLRLYAASMVQVLTAMTLIRECHPLKKGDFVLLYAAAGGAGLAFDQLLKKAGVRVIAVASTDEKLALAKENGAEFLINGSKDDVLKKVLEITGGEGVSVAYDSVGKDTFDTTLNAVKRKGTIVSFGNASGPVEPVDIYRLTAKNLSLMRPSVIGYISNEEDWKYYSGELVKLIDSGEINVLISKVYPLSEYKTATCELEARKTVGKLLLEIP
ncbi:LANO_0F16754g1_1 [Lachancea nothofagi CBS 11611]|uniref:Probable quinone oxidoreductase n=1 Tax=Lachancea nothofagi CBS 11611 TaxID=1266666 RepID=A0A1G4KDA8_9SACH|nr:LANO_0F16754g1_1 [Lachancea nothofagi CBS 11611]